MNFLGEWKGKTLTDLFDAQIRRYPDREIVVSKHGRFTYQEMGRQINSFGIGLLQIGVKKGDKVGIWLSNRPEWMVAEFAISKIGGIMVPLNTRLKAYDLEYILRQSDTTTLIMMNKFLKIDYFQILFELLPDLANSQPGALKNNSFPMLKNVICLAEERLPGTFDFNGLIKEGNSSSDKVLEERRASLKPDDIVNMPYTSGTTGFPKGVLTTHQQYLGQAVTLRDRLQLKDGDRFLSPAPFFANFGMIHGILMPVIVGGCTVPLESFDPEECLRLVSQEKCTHFSGTPTIYTDILNHPAFQNYDLRSLRTGTTGAGTASVQLINSIRDRMGIQAICNGYGMTENSGATTTTYADDPPEIIVGTTGKAFPEVELRIVHPKTGAALPSGEIGELCTKGWIVMKGYYKMPKETTKCFDSEGWFHTGDLGYLDKDGNFCITGRLKDMFISGGLNVYPIEVENFLCSFPKVKQAAVIGVPDNRMGEVGFAFIVPKEAEEISEEEVKAFCKTRIANYKVPKYVQVISEIPTTGIGGKVQKFKLQEIAETFLAKHSK